jgi:hypothetical protein
MAPQGCGGAPGPPPRWQGMARAAKLKVFRTPIGFHDAYVAAPSQKAALEAWGSDHNLFARGEAELVTDPALTKAPLAMPGTVIKTLRATADEQLAAAAAPARRVRTAATARAKPQPRPSRAALDEAEDALARADRRHGEARAALAQQAAALERKRHALEAAHEAELARLKRARDEAEEAYSRALEAWRAA